MTFDLLFSQNAMLPAGYRQRDQTKKTPTGPFDRDALQQHLEKQALEHEDRDDLVPFTGEKKGGRAGAREISHLNHRVVLFCKRCEDMCVKRRRIGHHITSP